MGGDELVPAAVPHHQPGDVRVGRVPGAQHHQRRTTVSTRDTSQASSTGRHGTSCSSRSAARRACVGSLTLVVIGRKGYARGARRVRADGRHRGSPLVVRRHPVAPRRPARPRSCPPAAGSSTPAAAPARPGRGWRRGAGWWPPTSSRVALPLYRERPSRRDRPGRGRPAPPARSPPVPSTLALCVTVLYHAAVASPAAVVGELARVVRPGGIVSLHGARRPAPAAGPRSPDPRRAPVLAAATSAGCSSTTGSRWCGPPAPTPSWCRRRRCWPWSTATTRPATSTGTSGASAASCRRSPGPSGRVLRHVPRAVRAVGAGHRTGPGAEYRRRHAHPVVRGRDPRRAGGQGAAMADVGRRRGGAAHARPRSSARRPS